MTDSHGHKPTSLRDYLRILRRRKWIVLLAAVLVPLSAALVTHQQPPRYEASADVLLNRQSLAATLNGSQDPNLLQDPDRLGKTQAALARVPTLAENVLRATGFTNRTPGGFLASSSVAAVAGTDVLLSFSVSDRSPTVAERLATAYATQYTLYRRQLDTDALDAARQQIQTRIQQLRASGLSTGSSLYATLVDKEQALRTLEALQGSNASVVKPADGANQTQPRTLRNGILGGLIGIVLGLGLAFLSEAVDRRVRSEDDLEAALGPPLLARLPKPSKAAMKGGELVMVEHPSSIEAEAFRRLRTNIEFANIERQARTIMVTSAGPKEGKTTTIANLAVAFARAGRRVALVDLDLRSPNIDRVFGIRGRPGVTHVALGHCSLDEALTRIPLHGDSTPRVQQNGNGRGPAITGMLEVLTAGVVPPNPGEFVTSDSIVNILDGLSDADLVLVDAPPLLAVGDTVALSARVDSLFVVVRMNMISREVLHELARTLEICTCEKLGYVIAGTNIRQAYGYAGYGYPAQLSPRERERVRR
jgi:Mrp family chromosome partitioning ATPase/capsular polysaccharide biosynthesis protein